MQLIDQYFSTARERYMTMLVRQMRPEHRSADPVFARWRFCNVHREDDKTTRWFKEHVRDHVGGWGAVQATLAFRWFNRIETAEKIVDLLTDGWDSEEARRRLEGVRPIVNGAYIILGKQGESKLDGVLWCIDTAIRLLRRSCTVKYIEIADETMEIWETWGQTLRQAWQDLMDVPYLGKFMAYEIVTDLRHTDVLNGANDIMTWANAGPGCVRGLGWVMHDDPYHFNYGSARDQEEMNEIMQQILAMSQSPRYWPSDWKPWEMREAEHWSCEFDKYKRAERGDRMKRSFR